jgi:hypothetical protein
VRGGDGRGGDPDAVGGAGLGLVQGPAQVLGEDAQCHLDRAADLRVAGL